LKTERKHTALWCDSEWSTCFGWDIYVYDSCNANCRSYTSLGDSYTNDTGLDKLIVLTGSKYFQVTEIEVFEITN
jgi:hypothetical protein